MTETTRLTGAELIAAERLRQITEEGYDAAHDRDHAEQLVRAGDAYAQRTAIALANPYLAPELYGHPADFGAWPWSRESWKPTGDAVRDLTKAGALIAAAIDSLQAGGDCG